MTTKKPDQKKVEKEPEKVPFDDLIGALLEVPTKPISKRRKPSKKDAQTPAKE